MDTVTVSKRYQVVIPSTVRKRMRIRPGQRLEVICFDERIELVPLKPIREMRGFLKGLDRGFQRDEDGQR